MSEPQDYLAFVKFQDAILQKEEDLKAWCPSSGEDGGRMIEFPGREDWHVQCHSCSAWWASGSTLLADDDRPV